MLVISNEEIERIMTLADCLDPLKQAYIELERQEAVNRERTHTFFPVEDDRYPGFRYRFKSQEGANLASGVWALRITSDIAGVETLPSGEQRRRLIPAAPGKKYCGLVTLYSLRTLEPLCIIHDSVLQKWRVAATSALAIDKMARKNAKVAGLFGSGWQAGAHLEAMFHIRPDLEQLRVFSPTKANCERFVAEYKDRYDGRVVVAESRRDAVAGCDIVTCATAAMEPCFDGSWVEPGTHLTSITSPDETNERRELDDASFDKASRIAVTSVPIIKKVGQSDILGPVERGHIKFEDIAPIGDLLSGKVPGRESDDEVTIFANNTGMGLQFAAVGAFAFEAAKKAGVGHDVPTDLFLEETTP